MMTRKQAMIGMLLAPFALYGQKQGTSDLKSLLIGTELDLNVSSRMVSYMITETIEKGAPDERYMLEVRADGRVARFTSKEVMDALGGWFEPDGK